MNKTIQLFINCIFPNHCIFCGTILPPNQSACNNCRNENPVIVSKKRMKIEEIDKTVLCTVPYSYKNKIRNSIIQYKFHNKKVYADYFCDAIVQAIIKSYGELKIDFVTCVPISKKRMKSRGYNQSEVLAKKICKVLHLNYLPLISKIKDNPEQHKLNMHDREKNVKGVYTSINKKYITNRTILIIDDIITTGSTLLECSKTLYNENAKLVVCAAIAEVSIE